MRLVYYQFFFLFNILLSAGYVHPVVAQVIINTETVSVQNPQFINLGTITSGQTPASATAAKSDEVTTESSSTTLAGYIRIIEVDPVLNLPKEALPFDRPFILQFMLPDETEVRSVLYKRIPHRIKKQYFAQPVTFDNTVDSLRFKRLTKKLYIYVPPLRPNSFYDFLIRKSTNNTYSAAYLDLFKDLADYDRNPTDVKLSDARAKLRAINDDKEIAGDLFAHRTSAAELCRIIEEKKKTCEVCKDITKREPTEYIIELLRYYQQHLKVLFNRKNLFGTLILPTKEDIAGIIASNRHTTLRLNDFREIDNCGFVADVETFQSGSWLDTQTHIFNFETRTRYSLNADFGAIAYGRDSNFWGISPYIGVNVELRYFDKDIPFRLVPKPLGLIDLSHWSIALGISQASVAKDGVRADFFKKTSFFTGVGYRLTSALRLTFGTLWYNKLDPNPLLDNKKLAVAPYAGLSIDLQVRKFIQNLGFGPKLENPDFFIPTNRR